MSKILENSIWPNTDGQLGNIKTVIPDGINTLWPEGDVLVDNFIYKDGKLVGLVDNKALVENESKSTVMPYDFVDITVNKRLETLMTFNAGERCKHLNVKYDIFLPKGYKRLEYLESTGTQYIDTGINLSNENEVTCEYMLPYDEVGNWFLFGVLDTVNKAHYSFLCNSVLVPKNVYAYVNDYKDYTAIVFNNAQRYGVKRKIYTNIQSATLDDITITNPHSSSVFQSSNSATLFSRGGSFSKARIYTFSISHAGEIQLNLIPCLNDMGTPCMYDIISQEPFYNEGTGQFLYPGAESQIVTSDLDEIFYAKKTAHGIQKLYHVPENFSGSKDEYAIENGFKQLVESPMPAPGYWVPEWTETDTQLICNWVEVDAPAEI